MTSNYLENTRLLHDDKLRNGLAEDPREWAPVNLELRVLTNRLQPAQSPNPVNLRVQIVVDNPGGLGLDLAKFARELLPESHKHSRIHLVILIQSYIKLPWPIF